MSTSVFIIEQFVAVERNSLRGFCRVRAPSGLIFHDVAVHQRSGVAWASPAAKPMLDRNGQQMRDAGGKALWSPIISFSNREARDRFSTAVVDAMRLAHPEALA